MIPPVRRRFVDVAGRAAHVRTMGEGPPALFVHSSPANSVFVVNEMASVADRYTCYAFDTPGFGQSDALPGDVLTVADLADALAANLEAIGMPPCPVFGTHTGAAIALELAIGHPQRVTGLMLDGLSIFTKAEYDHLVSGYFPHFAPDPLGGHFSQCWTRFRDQSTWFPWFSRDWRALNESDLSSPGATNIWLTMFFDAASSYAPAYRAALNYRDGPAQVAALQVPAILSAIESDMLYPHLDRLPPPGTHEIRRVGFSLPARRALTREAFDRFGGTGTAPVIGATAQASTVIKRQFVDVPGGQLHVRSIGDPANPALLIVHDSPGASARLASRMQALAASHFVVAFDLPGCGESLAPATTVADFADALAAGCDAFGVNPAAVWGVGFGSSVAAAFAALGSATLVIEGLLAAGADERAALRAHYAPPITIDGEGSHWYRTWLMLRDSLIWWPWFDRTRAAARRVDADFDAVALHDWTRETLRQPETYAGPIHAALNFDAVAAVTAHTGRLIVLTDSLIPLTTAYAAQIAALPGATPATLDTLAAQL